MIHDGERPGGGGVGARGDVARLRVLRGEHVIGITAVEQHLEVPGAQPAWIQQPLGVEAVQVGRDRQAPGDAAERARDPPGAQLQVSYDGIADEVQMAGQIAQLPGDVGAERARGAGDDIEDVQIPACAAVDDVGGLPLRVPVDVGLDLKAERIGRQQLADGTHVRALQHAVRLEEVDAEAAHHGCPGEVGNLEPDAVVNAQGGALDARVIRADEQPARQKRRRRRRRRMHAALHLDLGALHGGGGGAHVLQQQRRQGYAPGDVGELQVHQFVVDLHALHVQSVRHRAAQAHDVQRHAPQSARQVAHDELGAARGVEPRPHEHDRPDDERHDEHRRDQQQRLRRMSLDHSLGEKLMWNRGLLGAQLEPVNGAWHGSYKGCAMSMPRVSTGRRTRRPMPTE